jgi:NADH-quinone oxidoreductase subunit M
MISIITFLPVATVLAMLVVSRAGDRTARWTALFGSLATLGFALALLVSFDPAVKGYQPGLTETWSWVPSFGISYKVGIDWDQPFPGPPGRAPDADRDPLLVDFRRAPGPGVPRRDLLLETGMIGVFVAMDLLLFYVFWEVMLIPMYLLIGVWGSGNRIQAAVKFFLYTVAGSLLMFLAIVYLYLHVGRFVASPRSTSTPSTRP